MDYGIFLAPGADAWKTVQRAEALGFTHAWFYDSQLLCADVFVAMAAAAVNTSRITLGAGVLIPSNRNATVAANAMASLNRLAPGRIICGLGTGNTGRRTVGLRAHRLAELEDYARVIRELLAGEMTHLAIEGADRKVRFLNPELGLINIADPVPIHLSAFGPKARALTGRIADGFINAWAGDDSLGHVREVRDARRRAGRDPAGAYATCLNLGCVLAPGERADSARAMAQAGPYVAIVLHGWVEDGDLDAVPPPFRDTVAAFREVYEAYTPADARYLALHRGHLLFVRPDERRFISEAMIRAFTLTGTREEIRARVAQMEAAGYDQVGIQLVAGQEDALEDWADVLMNR